MIIKPLVSIVIPTMNRKKEIVETLNSLISLNIDKCEIIVVDDGSTDGLDPSYIQSLDDKIRVIRHEANRGGCAARNSGIDEANADFVAFLDSDDRWLPNKIEKQLSKAMEQPNGSKFLLVSNVIAETENIKFIHNVIALKEGDNIGDYMIYENQSLQTSTMLMPTWLAKEVRFRDGLPRHQDWDFVLRLEEAGVKILYDHEPLAIYNIKEDKNRVTLQPNRLKSTLYWFMLSNSLVSLRSMQKYFVRSSISKNGTKEIKTVIRGYIWISSLSYLSIFCLFRMSVHEVIKRIVVKYKDIFFKIK